MARRDKKNFPISFRVDGEQKDYIEELKQQGINLRDVLDYYKENNTNDRARLNNRCKYLVRHIKELEEELEQSKKELEEVRVQIGLAPNEEQLELSVSITAGTILNNCKIKNNGKTDTKTLANYYRTTEAQNIIDRAIIEYDEKDPEAFKKKLLKYLKL